MIEVPDDAAPTRAVLDHARNVVEINGTALPFDLDAADVSAVVDHVGAVVIMKVAVDELVTVAEPRTDISTVEVRPPRSQPEQFEDRLTEIRRKARPVSD